ncbi:alpha/beta hydrolase [Liquorilactobacillus mali]|uniref:alpha/beta hydrolase n=1 Tax=Liquorilactobacillus mali TaxID=1618 RepID=UPI0023DC341C|nr:alpha/beta hydrolase [Liquorilactobacillus mali]
MKKVLLTTLAASAAYLKYQSVRQKRSVQSLMVEQGLKSFLHGRDPRKALNFARFNHVNSGTYSIPNKVQNYLDFKWLDIEMQVLKRDSIVTPEKKVIFYLHGGSYWYQPFDLQYRFIARLADRVGASVVMPIYPKAPAHDANDALSMVMKSYQELLATNGVEAENIILFGDSAGGGLAVSLVEQLRNAQIDLPKQVILLSPWLDVSLENSEIKKLQRRIHF